MPLALLAVHWVAFTRLFMPLCTSGCCVCLCWLLLWFVQLLMSLHDEKSAKPTTSSKAAGGAGLPKQQRDAAAKVSWPPGPPAHVTCSYLLRPTQLSSLDLCMQGLFPARHTSSAMGPPAISLGVCEGVDLSPILRPICENMATKFAKAQGVCCCLLSPNMGIRV